MLRQTCHPRQACAAGCGPCRDGYGNRRRLEQGLGRRHQGTAGRCRARLVVVRSDTGFIANILPFSTLTSARKKSVFSSSGISVFVTALLRRALRNTYPPAPAALSICERRAGRKKELAAIFILSIQSHGDLSCRTARFGGRAVKSCPFPKSRLLITM